MYGVYLSGWKDIRTFTKYEEALEEYEFEKSNIQLYFEENPYFDKSDHEVYLFRIEKNFVAEDV